MKDLEEVRKEFPQYNDMSDIQLADALHQKYYSDISKKDFYTQIGLKPKRQGFAAIAEDALSGAMEAIPAAGHMLWNLPGQAYESSKQVLMDPSRTIKNIGAGFGSGGAGLLNAPANARDYLVERGILGEDFPSFRLPESILPKNYDYRKGVKLKGHEKGDELLYGLSQFLPNLFAGPVAPALWGIGQNENPVTAQLAPKFMNKGVKTVANKFIKGEKVFPPEKQEIIDLGEKHQVPILAQDIAESGSLIEKAGRLSEKPPIPWLSTVPERMQQQKAAKLAAEKAASKYEHAMIDEMFAGPDGMAKIEQAANGNGKRAQAAKNLLEEIENAPEDWNYILKNSGNAELLKNKILADEMYSSIDSMADKMGKISTEQIARKIDGYVNNLEKLPETNKDSIAALRAIKRDLMTTNAEVAPSQIVNTSGKPIIEGQPKHSSAQNLSFSELREVRSTLNDKIADYYTGKNTLVGKKGVQYLARLKIEIDDTLKKFATTHGPELNHAWNVTDTFYKEKVIPLKDSQLIKALKKESSPDEIFKMFIKNGGPEGDYGTGRALKFYKALDSKGQAAVRYGILKNALNDATDANGNFSLAKYATSLEKLEASRAVFFKGDARAEISGLAKLMRKIERAGQMKPPETGVQAISYVIGATAMKMSPKALAAATATSYGLRKLLTTKRGRNILYASSKLPANSPKWNKVLLDVTNIVGKPQQTKEDKK